MAGLKRSAQVMTGMQSDGIKKTGSGIGLNIIKRAFHVKPFMVFLNH
jgi:hypothetical protein